MARYEGVSVSVIRRLPRYHRFLYDLLQKDIHRISSRELAELIEPHRVADPPGSQLLWRLWPAGLRLQCGPRLYEEIGNILGLNRGLKIILLGAGNLGMALVKHLSFEAKGFRLIGIFDKNPRLIGAEDPRGGDPAGERAWRASAGSTSRMRPSSACPKRWWRSWATAWSATVSAASGTFRTTTSGCATATRATRLWWKMST